MTTRTSCPDCGLEFEQRRDGCPKCEWEMEYRDQAPLKRVRETPWGRLAAIYFASGFIIMAFAADVPDENPLAAFIGLFVIAWSTIFYFIPAFIAWKRRHHQTMAIAALDLFAGWTIVGWIGALIWSLTAVEESTKGAA